MQIALTKKLADAMKIKPEPAKNEENPLFTWTANWVKTWDNRRAEDTLVLVNHANRFTVAVYPVKRKDLKRTEDIMATAIENTLRTMNVNSDVIDDYMRQAGEITFVKNANRQATAWVNHSAQNSSFYIDRHFNGIDKIFNDSMGGFVSDRPVKHPHNPETYIVPKESMLQDLSALTGKELYNYRAFELNIKLDLEQYKAVRRVIVPATIDFHRLHHLMQRLFDWQNYHLHDFSIMGDNPYEPLVRLVAFEDDLEYAPNAILIEDQTLAEYFPEYNRIIYTYDYGDNWEHEIELVRVIEQHKEPSPYLLEAVGQAPPEDVGGVYGYLDFREIMDDPDHPEYSETKQWAGYWTPELSEWKQKPRLIDE